MFKIILIICVLLLSHKYSNAQKIALATVIDSLISPNRTTIKEYNGNICYLINDNLALIDTTQKSNFHKIHVFSSYNQYKYFVKANKIALLVQIKLLGWEGNRLIFIFQTIKMYWKMLKRKTPQFATHAGVKFYLIFDCEKNKWELLFHK